MSDAKVFPVLTIADIKVVKPDLGANKVLVRVRLELTDTAKQGHNAMTVLSSIELKNQMYDERHQLGLADFGIERVGSPRPYCEGKVYEHGSKFDGYEQEFRFTRR